MKETGKFTNMCILKTQSLQVGKRDIKWEVRKYLKTKIKNSTY